MEKGDTIFHHSEIKCFIRRMLYAILAILGEVIKLKNQCTNK